MSEGIAPRTWLAHIPYKQWDELRGALYNTFGWYMHHLTDILDLSEYEGMTPDQFVTECLNHGLETFKERYENVTRGDRI